MTVAELDMPHANEAVLKLGHPDGSQVCAVCGRHIVLQPGWRL